MSNLNSVANCKIADADYLWLNCTDTDECQPISDDRVTVDKSTDEMQINSITEFDKKRFK